MNLREWRSNSPKFMNDIPQVDRVKSTREKVLGVYWDSVNDEIAVSSNIPTFNGNPTKRRVAQVVASVFDPMGLFSPIRFKGIQFMQKLWEMKIGWDDPIPAQQVEKWI
jgi:hypothetical protein